MPKKNSTNLTKNKPASTKQDGKHWINLFGFGEKDRLRKRIVQQDEQIRILNNMLGSERRRSVQLALLSEVEQSLKTVLDQPVAAQLVVTAIQHALKSDVVTILTYNAEHKEFNVLAIAGKSKWYLPPSYRHRPDQALISRAARQRKTVLVSDTRLEPDFIRLENQGFLSEMVVPLIFHGNLKGVLTLEHEKTGMFTPSDANAMEIVAEQLVDAWERSNYHQRLTELIQEGITLSTLFDTQAAIEQVALTARKILEARFTFVTLLDPGGGFTRTAHAGNAPQLLRSLKTNPENNPLIQKVLTANGTIIIRDIRKSKLAANLKIEQTTLKGLMAFPIRLHKLNIGVILIFGKHKQAFFSENDESLVNLIASQTAAAIESAWLYQELRSTLETATLLFQLSTQIMEAEDLHHAAEVIIETAFKLGHASLAGIVLYTPDHQVQVQAEVDANGIQPGTIPPQNIIEQALQTRQTVIVTDDRFASKVCLPLQTPHRIYGVLWLDIPEGRWNQSHASANLQTLTHQATIALERSLLLDQTSNQARQLEAAYHELETIYDQTLATLTSALDARDRETEGHSTRVAKIACRLGEEIGLTPRQIKALERGALLHDFGKIGISDAILLKPGPLTDEEWQIMRRHPEIGARIMEGIPFLTETIPVLRYHHEHWDGSGYPLGLAGDEIPLLARIFAVVDAFDAMVSDRPYHKGTTGKSAGDYLQTQSGTFYDPEIVTAFVDMLKGNRFSDLFRKK